MKAQLTLSTASLTIFLGLSTSVFAVLLPDLSFLFDANPADSAFKDVYLGVQPLAKRELRPRADVYVARVERRQGLGTCATPCAWVTQAATCTTVDCECSVVNAAGPAAVAACTSCIQSVNATLAAEILTVESLCGSAATTPIATATAPPAGNPCLAQCNSINVAATSCLNDACFCPIIEVSGAACSQCYATVNITEAAIISSVMSVCSTEYPITPTPAPTAPPAANPCGAACNNINVAASSCPNDACFCPVLETSGSICSQCWATVNITQAGVVSLALSGCASEFPITGTTPIAPVPTSPNAANPCSAICNNIGVAATACGNDACFCPILEASGSACSSCYATINATEASIISSIRSECLIEYPPTTSALSSTSTSSSSSSSSPGASSTTAPKTSTETAKVTVTAASSSSGAEARKFGTEMFTGSIICFITLFAMLVGLISVL